MNIYDKARAYIYRHARPLEMARFRYHFENGSKEDVLSALAAYQNEDGGFGHALEADSWNPNSAPGQTCTAIGILREIHWTDASHPLMQGILRYLASGKDFTGEYWHSTIASNDNYPCAPWWKTGSESTSHHVYNITAALAGFLVRFAPEGSDARELGKRIAQNAAAYLLSPDANCDMHVMCCYQQMIGYCREAGETNLFDLCALEDKLYSMMKQAIHPDWTKWAHIYTATPSVFLRDKHHPLYPQLNRLCDSEVKSLLSSQLEDGSWPVTWQWDDYPDIWAVSKVWWKGVQIVERLLFLRGMDALQIQSRCGIICSEWRFTQCPGCVQIIHPFWGPCDVKHCCEQKKHAHCGQCTAFPCSTLNAFAYDEKEGDNGKRINQCNIWRCTL